MARKGWDAMTEDETRREIATMLRARADRLREDAGEWPENRACARELESLAAEIDEGAMSEEVRISVLTNEIMLLRAEVDGRRVSARGGEAVSESMLVRVSDMTSEMTSQSVDPLTTPDDVINDLETLANAVVLLAREVDRLRGETHG